MNTTLTNLIFIGSLGAALLAGSGCNYTKEGPQWQQEEKEEKYFRLVTRQLPPERVYNPQRFVRPPQVTPTRRTEASNAPLVMPISRFEVQNATLREAILTFAAMAGYRSYVANEIADRRISVGMLGTLDEIGAVIEDKAQVQVVIDHHNQEVRFLAKNYVAPELVQEPQPKQAL